MSNDLISREAVLMLLQDIKDSDAPKNYGTIMDIMRRVRNLPAAYDVDRVVEQLEEKAEAYDAPASSDDKFRKYCRGIATGYRYAVDIVKEEFERCGKPESEG